MTRRGPVSLPVLGPDPARDREGWELRFIADERRAAEMVELYRELGFEAVSDPATPRTGDTGCTMCFTEAETRLVYTRRVASGRPEEEEAQMSMGMECHPTEILREEHRLILAVADALESLVEVDSEELDYAAIGRCVEFVRLFADACHHGKEEDLLFPALEECGMPRDHGPIAVMLHEHHLGRQHAAAMADALPDAPTSSDARSRLREAARGYVDLIRNHILKEDHVLFGMADQMVLGDRRIQLCAAYDGTCDHSFGGCTKAELEGLAREILAGRS